MIESSEFQLNKLKRGVRPNPFNNKELLENAVRKSCNLNDVYIHLGIKPQSNRNKSLEESIKGFNISMDHLEKGVKSRISYEAEDISNGNRRLGRLVLEKFLNFHNIEQTCNNCSLDSWLGEKMSLDIDHINGDPTDNRLENLQYLCPNCHRLKTSGNKRAETLDRKIITQKHCSCGEKISKRATHCGPCAKKLARRSDRINWPEPELFTELVWEKPIPAIAEELKVSPSSLSRYLKRSGILQPGNQSGYWQAHNGRKFERCVEIRKKIEGNKISLDNA